MALQPWNFNLLDQLTFYGNYHFNRGNQLLHFFTIPLCLWSGATVFSYSGQFVSLSDRVPHPWDTLLTPNLAIFTLLAYVSYYLSLDFLAGISWALCVGFPAVMGGNAFYTWYSGRTLLWALSAHAFGWFLQIAVGHKMLEGRKPAIRDSFFQSLVLGPLFVWFDLLFLLGYRQKLRQDLTARVQKNVAEWKASQAQKAKNPPTNGKNVKGN